MGDINTVGVIGAGQMGSGIAHVCALGGREVRLHDLAADRLEAARSEIGKNLERQVAKGAITEAEAKAALGRITLTAQIAEAASADLVIEAATEHEETKKAIAEGNLEQISAATDKLTQASHKLAEAMYRTAGPQAGAPPPTGDGQPAAEEKKDNVVDAEFVDVDESKK